MKEILAHHVKISSLTRAGERKKIAPSEPTLFSKPDEKMASPEKNSEPKSVGTPMLKARKVEDMALAVPMPKRMKVIITALFAFLLTHYVRVTHIYILLPFLKNRRRHCWQRSISWELEPKRQRKRNRHEKRLKWAWNGRKRSKWHTREVDFNSTKSFD